MEQAHNNLENIHQSGAPFASERVALGDTPSVSVVIPCFNEERFIADVLANLLGQYDWERYEIIVVDGMSTDRTRAVVREFIERNQGAPVKIVDNPIRHIPRGLNIGIEHARGQVIVRMDAHSIPSVGYVRRCVQILDELRVEVAGMPWRVRPGIETATAQSIALAVSHPFGIGDAKYRMPDLSEGQFVDTVPFGAFRRSLWQEIGGFNEDLLANEDYDFHYRVRRHGGRIFLDTSEYCTYFARPTIGDLASQYFRYGRWKAQMIKLHPRSIRLRQIIAPMFVVSLVVFALLSALTPLAIYPLMAIAGSYGVLAFAFAVAIGRRTRLALVPIIALAFLVVHIAWGSSFLLGLLWSPRH